MVGDLTDRLLKELDDQVSGHITMSDGSGSYSIGRFDEEIGAALRKIVESHRRFPYLMEPRGFWCSTCGNKGGFWPCPTIVAIAEALKVPL